MKVNSSLFDLYVHKITFPIAVAVSGGADSLALLLLAHDFAKKNSGRVLALTVDHDLRPESSTEAHQVKVWAQARGIEHIILEWQGEKPKNRLQEKAREARYQLLTNWCKENDISHLFLGHHGQDQEETFWIRLSSGSGLDGLSGMKKSIKKNGVFIHRPLLSVPKEHLKSILSNENQEWIEDPSNHNDRFLRGRLRESLKEEGLSSSRLLNVMEKLNEDAAFIQQNVEGFLKTNVSIKTGGYIGISKRAFFELHPAIAKRVISFLVDWFRGASYPPRSKQIATILENIKEGNAFTSGGIHWIIKKDEIFLFREFRAIKDSLCLDDIKTETLWDNRFWIDPAIKEYVSRETILAPLGARQASSMQIAPHDTLYNVPHLALQSLPVLWEKGNVVAIFPLCDNNMSCEKDLQKKIFLKPLFHDSLMITM